MTLFIFHIYIHLPLLHNRYVADPREIVKAGDVVKVKVLEVDEKRKRIALTMRLDNEAGSTAKSGRPSENTARNNRSGSLKDKGQKEKAVGNTAMADAFARLKK